MWQIVANLVAGAISPITKMVDDLHTSDEEKAAAKLALKEVESALTSKVMTHTENMVSAQKEVIVAEIQSGWLSRSWRPILMLTIVAIVANNYLIFPYASLFTDKTVVLDLPDKLWSLMQIGVGGYIAGRSGEKLMETFKK